MYEEATEILTVEETAELLYVGRNTIYALLGSGELKGFRIGRTWKIPRDAISEFIMRKCGER